MVYIFATLCYCNMSLSKVRTRGCNFALPIKKALKSPTKNGLSAVWRHLSTSLLVLQFGKRHLKTPSWTFLIKNWLQTDAFVAFVKSLSSVPLTSSLSTATWQRSLQQGDFFYALEILWMAISSYFVLYRIVIPKALWIWPNAHFFWNNPFRVFRKILLRIIQKKVPRKTKVVAPNPSNISGRKCLW